MRATESQNNISLLPPPATVSLTLTRYLTFAFYSSHPKFLVIYISPTSCHGHKGIYSSISSYKKYQQKHFEGTGFSHEKTNPLFVQIYKNVYLIFGC